MNVRACVAQLLVSALAFAAEGTITADGAAQAPANPKAPVEPKAQAAPQADAKPKGNPSLTAYYANGFADAAWQQAAFDKVAKSWSATAPPALGKKTVVISQITREGKILESKVGTASGSEAWDKAALDAVTRAAPYRALPAAWTASSLEVHWHFQLVK